MDDIERMAVAFDLHRLRATAKRLGVMDPVETLLSETEDKS